MISTQVRQSLDSSHSLVVPGLDEHSSLSLSSSLKNETDPPPLQSILTLDQVLEPSFPPPSENVSISNQKPKRGKKKSHWRKRCLGEDLQPLDIMLEKNCQLLPKKLGENYL
jgi:hypothetical protein